MKRTWVGFFVVVVLLNFTPAPLGADLVGDSFEGEVVQVDSKPSGWKPIMWAANSGDIKEAKKLIKAGADVNAASYEGWSTLMAAADKGRTEMVRFLIDKGADVNTADRNGWTALIAAANWGYVDIVKMLLKAGADPAARDDGGTSAAELARSKGFDEAAGLIEEAIEKAMEGR